MERFAKIVNAFQPLTIFEKWSILDVWQGSEYASDTLSPSPRIFLIRFLEVFDFVANFCH